MCSQPSIKGYLPIHQQPITNNGQDGHVCFGGHRCRGEHGTRCDKKGDCQDKHATKPEINRPRFAVSEAPPAYYIIPVKGEHGIIPVSVDDVVVALLSEYQKALNPFEFSKLKDILEYAIRMGRKPGSDLISEFRKIEVCARQAANFLENMKPQPRDEVGDEKP